MSIEPKHIFFWLKNYGAVVLLGIAIGLNVVNVVSKEYVFGQRFFPVLAVSVSVVLMVGGLYKRMREQALWESLLIFAFLALYALAYFFSETKNFGLSEVLAVASSLLIYLALAHRCASGQNPECLDENRRGKRAAVDGRARGQSAEIAHYEEGTSKHAAAPADMKNYATASEYPYTESTNSQAAASYSAKTSEYELTQKYDKKDSSKNHNINQKSEHTNTSAYNIIIFFLSASALLSTLIGYYFFFTRPAARFHGAFLNIASISDNWPNAFALFALMVWPLMAARGVQRGGRAGSDAGELDSAIAEQTGAKYAITSAAAQDTSDASHPNTARVHTCASSAEQTHSNPIAQIIKKSPQEYISTAALALLLSGLFLTFSRAAYLVFIIQLIFLAFIFFTQTGAKILLLPKGAPYNPIKWPRLKKILLHATIIATIAIALAMSAQWIRRAALPSIDVTERLTFQTEEKTTSISERLEFWTGGLKLALEKPMLGYGPSSFRFIYPRIQKTLLASSDHPHNLFVKIAAEAGLPAAIIFIAFFAVTFAIIGKRIRFLEHEEKIAAIFLLTALIGGILHNLVDYNWNFLENLLIFWVILAILRSMTAFPHLTKPRTIPAVLILALVLAAVSVFEARLFLFKKQGLEKEAAGVFFEGEKYLEAYEYTNFPRNYFIERADTFRSEGNLDLAESALKKHLALNANDSEAWHRLGEIQREQERLHEAFESFKKALSLNPKNHFWYWWNFLDAANRLGRRQEIEKKTPQLLALLAAYESQLKINLHFTRETPNYPASIALWKLLAELYPEKSADFREKAAEFETMSP